MVQCADHSLYTGIAKDVIRRLRQHNAGKGARYTRGRRPVVLVYREVVVSHRHALRREYTIKQLSLKLKRGLVESYVDTGIVSVKVEP